MSFFLQLDTQRVTNFEILQKFFRLHVYQRYKNTLFSHRGVRKRLRIKHCSNYVVYKKKA